MDKNNVLDFVGREDISDPLTALLKAGAQHSEHRTSDGKMTVVRNG